MSDEARDAYLQWLDACAKEQETDYETWLEGRVALLEAENKAAKTHIREIIETTKAQRTEIEELIADLTEAKLECNRLYGIGQDYDADLTETRGENATLKLERDIAMSENQRLTKIVEDYEEENAALKAEMATLKGDDDGTEQCMNCGSMVEQTWHVSDELWNNLSGYPQGNGVLCPRCFDRKALKRGVYLYWACQPDSYPRTEYLITEQENATLKAKLAAIECAGCGKTMLECACDE